MQSSKQVELEASLFDQVWSSSDLNPDTINRELNQLFTYNENESTKSNFTDLFFDLNEKHLSSSQSGLPGSLSGGASFGGVGVNFGYSLKDELAKTTKTSFTLNEIKRMLEKRGVKSEWNGLKLIAKSFEVYNLVDIAQSLQTAIISMQRIADKKNGAMVRTVNTRASRANLYSNLEIVINQLTDRVENLTRLNESNKKF
jgi:hypothetical protein